MSLPDNSKRLPPGPTDPVTLGIDPDTLETLENLQSRYGNMVGVTKPGGRAAQFINDPSAVRQLLVKNHSRYRKGPGFERVKMLLGNGLIVSDGDTWRRSRRMIQPSFSRQNVHRLIEVMVECTESRAANWELVANDGETLDITQEMNDFALELILKCIFGSDYEEHILAEGTNPFAFLSRDSARDLRVVMQVRESRDLISQVITKRRNSDEDLPFDFLAMYMSATDKNGQPFTDAELLDELITLIVAGYETSAGTLNWAWFLLTTHADAEYALLREARASIPDVNALDQQGLADMRYTQQLLEETLRLYPPVWLFTRRAEEDDNLEGYDIEAGTDIYLSPYILHRTEAYWPQPNNFDPSRFDLESSVYKKGERPYFPFSLGPRRCLGEYFSFLEMKVHLGLLIQQFHMTLVSDPQPELDLGINLRTRHSIIFRPEIRSRQ
ncbi:MAG: cytochrome P450 [Woeseiaceae bacterium]